MKRLLNLIVTIGLLSVVFVTAQTPAEKPINAKREKTIDQVFDEWLKNAFRYAAFRIGKKAGGNYGKFAGKRENQCHLFE